MHFTSKFNKNDDPLSYLMEIGFMGMTKNVYKTLLVYSCLVSSSLVTIFGLFHTCLLSNWKTCKRNLPSTVLFLIYNIIFLIAPCYKSKLTRFVSILQEEGIRLRNDKNGLHKQCFIVKVLFICLQLLWLFAFVVVMMSMNTCKYTFVENIIDQSLGAYWQIFLVYFLSYGASLVVAYYALSMIAVYIYIANHVKFQFSAFNAYLIYLNSKRVKSDAIVNIEIKRAIIMHQKCLKIFKAAKLLIASYSLVLALYTIVISAVGLYVLMFDVCSTNDLVIILLNFMSMLFFCWFSFLVQSIFDEMNQVYLNLLDFAWFNWNQRNKNLFRILLLKNLQPLEDKYYGIPSLDFRLMFQVTRIIYSIFAFFINIRKTD